MSATSERLLRLVFSNLNDIEEWKLADPRLAAQKGYPRRMEVDGLDEAGIVFADFALEAGTLAPVCHEVNGPNAVGSDALTGDSAERAEVEARAALRRFQADQSVVSLHAHQHWKAFRTGGEFYPRVARFAELMQEFLPGNEVVVRGAGEALGSEALSVVVGDVPSVGAQLEIDPITKGMRYRGRPVIFIGNPNLLSELLRRGKKLAGADLRVVHAWRLAHLVHDKAAQQALFEGSGIRPLRHFEARSREEALRRAREHLAQGPVVLKPNGGSGGTGVHVVVPGMSEGEIRARIEAVLADFSSKHGENAEAVAFPIRGFEFVRSTGYPMADGEHVWDLRVAVQFEPGRASVYPVSMRLAPKAFDARTFHLDRDQWISNVSGRQVTLLKSGLDDAALAAVGMSPARLEQVLDASVAWTLKAWASQRVREPETVAAP